MFLTFFTVKALVQRALRRGAVYENRRGPEARACCGPGRRRYFFE